MNAKVHARESALSTVGEQVTSFSDGFLKVGFEWSEEKMI